MQAKLQNVSSESNNLLPYWSIQDIEGLDKRISYTCTLIKNYVVFFAGFKVLSGTKPGAFSQNVETNEVVILDLNTNTCKLAAIHGSIPITRVGHTACLYKEDHIIVYGGISEVQPAYAEDSDDEHTFLDEVGVLNANNIESGIVEWNVIHALDYSRFGRYFHTAHIKDDYMYVFGGFSKDTLMKGSNTLLRFDLNSRLWVECQTSGEKPNQDFGHCSALYDNSLYVFGTQMKLHSVKKIDLKKMVWQTITVNAPPYYIGKFASSQQFGSKIYISGSNRNLKARSGDEHNHGVLVYDIVTNLLENYPAQHSEVMYRTNHKSIYYQDKLLIFGDKEDKTIFTLHFGLEGSKEGQNSSNKAIQSGNSQEFVLQFQKLLLNNTFSDLTFLVEDQQIPAHKAILAMRCKYFENMFVSGMTESHSSKIEIKDISFQTFRALLEFIYCNQVELTQDLALRLLEVSEKYLFAELQEVCEKFLGELLNVDNFVQIGKTCEKFDVPILKKSIVEYVMKNRHVVEEKKKEPADLSKSLLWEVIFKLTKK